MIHPHNAQESILKRKVTSMSSKEVTAQISKVKKDINKKLKTLENTGYNRYSHTYEKVLTFIKEETGVKSNILTSKHISHADLKTRQEFLYRITKISNWEGLTPESIEASLQKSAEKLNRKGVDVTTEQLKQINEYMGKWYNYMNHSTLINLLPSDQVRTMFSELTVRNTPTEQIDNFINELEKFDNGEYKKRDFDIFLNYYDFNKGVVVAERNGIKFNPMNGTIYDDNYERIRTSMRVSRSGEELEVKNKKRTVETIKLSNFDRSSDFYDFVLNNRKSK